MRFIKHWFEKKPVATKAKETLSETYNHKYGHYDYSQDSRVLDKSFLKTFEDSFSEDAHKNAIVCGANSGYEINIIKNIKPKIIITAVDISDISLKQLHANFPDVELLHEDLENLSALDSKSFGMYICLRAIHSSNIDITKAINEAVRVTRNKIILSISNGYLINGELVKGMYDYETKTIDPKKPFMIRDTIFNLLNDLGWKTEMKESEAEIFIVAVPN